MHSFDTLARSLTSPAPRSVSRHRGGQSLLAPVVALSCATLPLVTMIQVYISSV